MRNESVKYVWGRRPHTFFILLLRNSGPQTSSVHHLLHNFMFCFVFVVIYFLAYRGESTILTFGGPALSGGPLSDSLDILDSRFWFGRAFVVLGACLVCLGECLVRLVPRLLSNAPLRFVQVCFSFEVAWRR